MARPVDKRDILERKQLKESMNRFGDAMDGLSNNVGQQTNILSKMLETQLEEEEKKRREDEFEKLKDKPERQPKEEKSQSGWKLAAQLSAMSMIPSRLMSLDIAGMIAKAGGLAVLAPIVAESAKNLLTVAVQEIGASDALAKSIGENVGAAAGWGTFGLIFGRKVAFAMAAGSLLWNYVDDAIDLESKIQGLGDTIGIEISPAIAGAIGTVSTTAILLAVPALIKKSVALAAASTIGSLRLAAGVAASIAPGISGAMAAGAKIAIGGMMRMLPIAAAAGIATLYANYGDQASAWLSEQTGVPVAWTEQAVQSTTFVAAGASLGLMFGPGGAVVGAITGLIASLGYSVYKWFEGRRAEARKAAIDAANDADKQIEIMSMERNSRGTLDSMVSTAENAGAHKYTYNTQTGQNLEVNDIIAPIQDIGSVERSEQIARTQAMSERIKKIIGEYGNGSPEKNDELIRTLQSLYALKAEIDRKDTERGSRDQSIDPQLRNMLKRDGNKLLEHALEMIPTDAMNALENGGEIPKFRKGTAGFQDFGRQSIALLHGREAVVPDGTDAAAVLKQFFNSDWSAKIKSLSNTSLNSNRDKAKFMQSSNPSERQGNVTIAPTTIAPVTSIHRGNMVNNSRFTSFGGSSDLDFGLPKGVL